SGRSIREMRAGRSARWADGPTADAAARRTGSSPAGRSCHDRANRDSLRLGAGQPLVKALEIVSQPLVINAHQVEDRRIDVANVDRVADDVVAEIVCFAMHSAALDAAARHPHGVTARMMITAIVVAAQLPLAIDGAAEFAAPDDERFIQQTALL